MAAADSNKKTPLIRLEVVKAAAWGTTATLILAVLIVVGSRNLSHFDAVLVGYTFATLFAVFGITYRAAAVEQNNHASSNRLTWARSQSPLSRERA
jgi:hypothetical protein